MKLLKKFIVALTLVSSVAHAGPVMVAEIENIRVRPSMVYINIVGCNKYVKIPLVTDYDKAMYTAALSAAAANKQIRVEFVASSGCSVSETTLEYLEVNY